MDDQLECVICVICGQDNAELFIRTAGPTQIVRCRNDRLLYRNPRAKSVYVRDYFTQYVRKDNIDFFTHSRQDALRREAQAIKRIKPGGNLLDVGCATGVFFENFPQATWCLYGVEPATLGAEVARTRYGAEVFCGSLREGGYPDSFFDIVTVLDALFYIEDPKAELLEIGRILKDDGLLAIEIPGLTYQLLRDRGPLCWLLDRTWNRSFAYPWHLYFYSSATLGLLLKTAGFRVIQEIPEQASLDRQGIARTLNDLHFAMARLLFKVTTGRFSVAGKELYLAVKANSSLVSF